MNAIEILVQEHVHIVGALDALDRFCARARQQGQASADTLADFVRFIREYADAHHHGKEEDILFKAMIDTGFPVHGGPVAIMLHEHELGRAYVVRMRAAAAQGGQLTGADLDEAVAASSGYTALLRQHIYKEDNILYPMSRSHLGDAMAAVDAQVDRFETSHRAQAQELVALKQRLDTLTR